MSEGIVIIIWVQSVKGESEFAKYFFDAMMGKGKYKGQIERKTDSFVITSLIIKI
jgi:hypothetical protein